jgi:hypothetical protein
MNVQKAKDIFRSFRLELVLVITVIPVLFYYILLVFIGLSKMFMSLTTSEDSWMLLRVLIRMSHVYVWEAFSSIYLQAS